MAKRFAYASFGLLCLVAAYQLGAERASAEWDAGGSGFAVAVAASTGGQHWVWTRDGKAWQWSNGVYQWNHQVQYDLPIPVADVMLLTGEENQFVLATRDGSIYFAGYASASWSLMPPVPGPVALPAESWGGVKGKYK